MDIYCGGTILTMEEETDKGDGVQAVCTQGGKIIFAGEEAQARARYPQAQVHDLRGGVLMPAFLDAHSHLSSMASESLQVSMEQVTDMEGLRKVILEYLDKNHIKPGEWIRAKGFDHSRMGESSFPDRDFLDGLLPENPFILQHKSGHMGVLNSRALKELGIREDSEPPKGGFMEKKDGRLTGYMEENAFIQCMRRVGPPDMHKLMDAYVESQEKYASYGITTIQEGMMEEQLLSIYRRLTEQKYLTLDVVGYADAACADRYLEAFGGAVGRYEGNFRLGGLKIFLDGSPQGRTAWMSRPYQGEESYCGYGTMSDEQVYEAVEKALDTHMQLLAHCNGDAAADQFLRMAERAAGEGGDVRALRPVIIHAQLLAPSQMGRVRANGMIPSFFVGHVYEWGELHRRNFGETRAASISPAGTAMRYGLPFTFHQDSPVLEPDMLKTVWCAVNRVTKEGTLLGEEERIPVYEALKAVTIHAAHQYFEEETKGSIRAGKWADFVILDRNPLTVPSMEIKDMRVMATIRRGKLIYRR